MTIEDIKQLDFIISPNNSIRKLYRATLTYSSKGWRCSLELKGVTGCSNKKHQPSQTEAIKASYEYLITDFAGGRIKLYE